MSEYVGGGLQGIHKWYSQANFIVASTIERQLCSNEFLHHVSFKRIPHFMLHAKNLNFEPNQNEKVLKLVWH